MESNPFVVSQAPASDRLAFFRRTYLHVAGAFAAFGALLWYFFHSSLAATIWGGFGSILGAGSGFGVLAIMALFWGGSYVAQRMAENRASRAAQYMGLGFYVVLQAVMFVPLLVLVALRTDGQMAEILVPACGVTAALVVGLTVAVFTLGVDFSFLRVAIIIGSVCALGVMVIAAFTDSALGNWFSIAMIVLMASVILYQTQVVKDRCETDQHVLAAFILFSAFVTLLWYVIRLFLGRRSN